MKLYGLQKLTLLDFPDRVAALIFLDGCNFRCPFCQNSDLVLSPDLLQETSLDEFEDMLKKRQKLLDGICISGGEPTLHKDLPSFLAMIKEYGYQIKLDTNGSNPDMLEALISQKLLDYVAMDIKAGRQHYIQVCGLDSSSGKAPSLFEKICRSIRLLMNSPVEYEFRTTAVKGLHSALDFQDIALWIPGASHYYIQNFRDCPQILQEGHSFAPFSDQELGAFLNIVKPSIPSALIR